MPQTVSCDPLVKREPWLPGKPQGASAPCNSLSMRVQVPPLTCRGDSLSPSPATGSQRVAVGINGDAQFIRICRWLQLIHKGWLAPLENTLFSTPWARKRCSVAQRFHQYLRATNCYKLSDTILPGTLSVMSGSADS